MAYWLDDSFDTWPEVVRAGKAASGLYVCCGAWIARNISNGNIADAVIPAEVATMYGTPEWVAKLAAVGLWSTEEAGYRDVRYFGMGNPTAEKARARRKAEADRKARWRAAQDARRKAGRPHVPPGHDAGQTRDGPRDTTRDGRSPLPFPPPKGGEGGRPPASPGGAAAPQPPSPTADDNPDWRTLPAIGQLTDAQLDLNRRRAAQARAALRPAPPDRPPDDPDPPPPAGPAPDDDVWIATHRRRVEAHRIDPAATEAVTACRRATRTGHHLTAAQATERHQATWCHRCWPPQGAP